MATIGATYPTLVDKAVTEQDKMLVEILTQKHPLIEDMMMVECNDGTSHRTRIRTGLPAATWRRLYEGVQPNKGTTAAVRDTTANLEAYGEVDLLDYDLQGENKDVWRMEEQFAHIEGMSQQAESAFWYSNEATSPEKFTGMAPRYNALTGVNTAENVINAQGQSSGECTSVWLIGHGPQSMHGIYPKGTQAGLSMRDLGESTKELTDGSLYQILRMHFAWRLGWTLRDWRCAGRICNIDISDIRGTADNQKALIKYMIQLSERVERPSSGTQFFYCNQTIFTGLRLGILEKIANNLTWETVEGKRVMVFDEIIIRRSDALLNTEATVS